MIVFFVYRFFFHLGDVVAAPLGLEAVVLAFDFDEGARTVDRVRRAQVVERDQQVQVRLRLSSFIRVQFRCRPSNVNVAPIRSQRKMKNPSGIGKTRWHSEKKNGLHFGFHD